MLTVIVHFPSGKRKYPAHVEFGDPLFPGRHDLRVPHVVPDDNDIYDFHELITGEWVAHLKLQPTFSGDDLEILAPQSSGSRTTTTTITVFPDIVQQRPQDHDK